MSTVLWKQPLQPSWDEQPAPIVYDVYGPSFCVRRTIAFPCANSEIVDLPDPRAYRALSRAGLLLTAVGLPVKPVLAPFLANDPASVGMYCAIENGPDEFESAKQMICTNTQEFAARYKTLRPPKHYFKMLANVPASQLAIFLGVAGPLHVSTNSQYGALHALRQAEFDLNQGIVKLALVCSAFSLEDPLLSMRTRQNAPPGSVLCEGAGCVVLAPDQTCTKWKRGPLCTPENRYYGCAHDIVMLAASSMSEARRDVQRQPATPDVVSDSAYQSV